MDIFGKVWGTTETLYSDSHTSLHLLRLRAGACSSEHMHERKTNHFFVIDGIVEIYQWPIGTEGPDVTRLEGGQSTRVGLKIWHQFKVVEDAICLELCRAAPVEEDIIRRTTGGMNG